MDNSEDSYLDYQATLYNLFNSESGKTVLKELRAVYVDTSAIEGRENLDVNATLISLGRKEFVQNFIKEATTNPEELTKLMEQTNDE